MKNVRALVILAVAWSILLAYPMHAQTCALPPPGLVGWWPGNGSSSDVYGGNHGTLENGATFGAGKVGQGFSLDGIDDYVLIPHNPNQNLTSFSLQAWFKVPFPSGDFQTIVTKTDHTVLGGETRNYGIYVMPDVGVPPSLQLHSSFAYSPGAFAAVQNQTPAADGLFHHVIVTFESSVGLKIYFDGVEQTEPSGYPSIGIGVLPGLITAPITIGINSPFVNVYGRLRGIVDEVALFNRALSPSEIQTIFAAGSAGMCGGITGDLVGPVTSVVAANPVVVNTGSFLAASISDATTGGGNVVSANYSINGAPASQMSLSPSAAVTVAATANLPPFSQSNVYDVCVRGTDGAGNTGDDACIPLPVYDPTGGFVTGGGQVESPVGTDLANTTSSGPAKFGFVSKYLPGRNTPSGNLEFQFKQGNLNFKSTSMDWLVVTGQPRAIFRGTGTVNGAIVCKFEVDAWDGSFQPMNRDAFGLKLFSCSNGSDRYDLSPTALTGGSIIIH